MKKEKGEILIVLRGKKTRKKRRGVGKNRNFLDSIYSCCNVWSLLSYLDHETLYEDVVGAGAAGNDVGKVGQLLDQDDTVVDVNVDITDH